MRLLSSALTRGFASSGVKRAKAIRIKKSEARRVIPDIPKPSHALTEVPTSPLPANPLLHSEQQPPQTFGGIMKESFLWGMGMAVAFSIVGILFTNMEELSLASNEVKESFVVPSTDHED